MSGQEDDYLWLQHPLCAAGAVQADALIHTVISGKIIAHLVAVATAFILRSTVSAALCLRRLLQEADFKNNNRQEFKNQPRHGVSCNLYDTNTVSRLWGKMCHILHIYSFHNRQKQNTTVTHQVLPPWPKRCFHLSCYY